MDCECIDFGVARKVFDCRRVDKDELERGSKHAEVEAAKEGCAVGIC